MPVVRISPSIMRRVTTTVKIPPEIQAKVEYDRIGKELLRAVQWRNASSTPAEYDLEIEEMRLRRSVLATRFVGRL